MDFNFNLTLISLIGRGSTEHIFISKAKNKIEFFKENSDECDSFFGRKKL